jgi:16S rRNA (guanine527-N7)-methyltransferase
MEQYRQFDGCFARSAIGRGIDRLLTEPVIAAAQLRGSSGLLVDIGSGGGSPAIPLRIMSPALRLVMIESKARKSSFLREAVRQLNLPEAEVLTTRFEDAAASPDLAGKASWLSVRAVRADRTLWDSVAAIAAKDGRVLWFRSAADPVDQKNFARTFLLQIREAFPAPLSGELVVLRRSER